jgi:tetratricopeptide (TPR) repeat protein
MSERRITDASRRRAAEEQEREGCAIEYPRRRRRLEGPPPITAEQRRRAMAKYARAIELDPRFAKAYVSRSHARRALGDRAGARDDAAAAYRLRPSDPMTYLSIALPFDRSVQRRILRSGIARATPGSWEHFHLGWYSAQTYWYEGRFEAQVRALDGLIRRFEKLGKRKLTAGLHYHVGTALLALGNYVWRRSYPARARRDDRMPYLPRRSGRSPAGPGRGCERSRRGGNLPHPCVHSGARSARGSAQQQPRVPPRP